MSYPRDWSQEQWTRVAPFFERPAPRGAKPKPRYARRRRVEGILCRWREGCRWRALPKAFPPRDSARDHWRHWQQAVSGLNARWRKIPLNPRQRRSLDLDGHAALARTPTRLINSTASNVKITRLEPIILHAPVTRGGSKQNSR